MSEAMTTVVPESAPIEEIIDNFSLLDEWDDRYRYVIELGRAGAAQRTRPQRPTRCRAAPARCGWQRRFVPTGRPDPCSRFGDSDAHIVRGLIAILFALFSGKPARSIAADAIALFNRLGLREHLAQRSNGFRSMVERIKLDARTALATAA